jgi:hypothetical protein
MKSMVPDKDWTADVLDGQLSFKLSWIPAAKFFYEMS